MLIYCNERMGEVVLLVLIIKSDFLKTTLIIIDFI
jgi:hypothetical protein